MAQSKNEVIREVARQFVLGLNKEYFDAKRASGAITTILNDKSRMNRLLDNVGITPELTQAYYDLAMRSDNPVDEILEPLVEAIAAQLFEGWWNKDVAAGIKENLPEYQQIRDLFANEAEFQDTLVRALASGCAAILTDQEVKRLEMARAAGEPDDGQAFSNKISMPFDNYATKASSAILFYPAWVRHLYEGLSQLIARITRRREPTIEEKMMDLMTVAQTAKTQVDTYADNLPEESSERAQLGDLSRQLNKLKNNLNDALDTMNDQKIEGMPYQEAGEKLFDQRIKTFTEYLHQAQKKANAQNPTKDRSIVEEVIGMLSRDTSIAAGLTAASADKEVENDTQAGRENSGGGMSPS
ncbi:MAG: hypothetical protein NXI01_03780 [Gammaproteobacteria bacterium]|nr:hypothetical protein [Gammaproteobacteria bacterium]